MVFVSRRYKQMAYKINNPDDIIVARAGALHEKLTELVTNIQAELKAGNFVIDNIDPAFFAANILTSILHSGDGRIHSTSLTR